MPWVRLDDQFVMNQKAILAGKDGRMLYLTALCYSSSQLTDGFIRDGVLPTLAGIAEVDDLEATLARLVEVGMFEPVEGGYRIHDYLQYNPSGEQVRAQRAQNAQRQADWRTRRRRAGDSQGDEPAEVRNAVTNAVTDEEVMHAPGPLPGSGTNPGVVPSNLRGAPPSAEAEERETIGAYVDDFARELGDEASLRSSTSRAVNLYRRSGLSLEEFLARLYEARTVTKERWASIKAPGKRGRSKSGMAYFFAVLGGLLGGRSPPGQAQPETAKAGSALHGVAPGMAATGS